MLGEMWTQRAGAAWRDTGRRRPCKVSVFLETHHRLGPARPGTLRNLVFIQEGDIYRAGSAPDIDFVGTGKWLHPSWG